MRARALKAGPQATHSYQVNNLFVIPLCYVKKIISFSWMEMGERLKKKIHVNFLCLCECHDITAHDVMTTT